MIDGTLATLFLAFLFVYSPAIAGFGLLLSALLVGFLVCTTRAMHRLMSRELANQAQAQAYLIDVIAGMSTVKASGAELRVWDKWAQLFQRHVDAVVLRLRLTAAVTAVGRTIQLGVPLAVLLLGWLLVTRGQITLGTLLALAGVTAAFLGP